MILKTSNQISLHLQEDFLVTKQLNASDSCVHSQFAHQLNQNKFLYLGASFTSIGTHNKNHWKTAEPLSTLSWKLRFICGRRAHSINFHIDTSSLSPYVYTHMPTIKCQSGEQRECPDYIKRSL